MASNGPPQKLLTYFQDLVARPHTVASPYQKAAFLMSLPDARRLARVHARGKKELRLRSPETSEAIMTKRDIYQEITDKIIRLLEQVDLEDYQAPFASLAAQGLPYNPVTGHNYQGINIPSLWIEQQERGFASPHWATFKQWKQKGASIRKGEKSSLIIFFKTWNKTEADENGEEQQQKIPVMRFYSVFNADQVDGYKHTEQLGKPGDKVFKLQPVEDYCQQTKADIRHGGNRAFYRASGDFIQLPDTTAFIDTDTSTATENYYSILLHELTHWSGAPHRLDRDKAKSKADQTKYAFEELIAELCSAFLCARLNIMQTPCADQALYIKSWLQALRNDRKFMRS